MNRVMQHTVSITAPMVSSDEAHRQVHERWGREEVDDGVARTIAGWWASPGSIGKHLAALSTGCEVTVEELLDDVSATRRVNGQMHPDDKRALDMLCTWALNTDL